MPIECLPQHVRFGSIADMCSTTRHVRFVPIADIRRRLFDHIVSGQKNAVWYGDAKRFRGLEIDY